MLRRRCHHRQTSNTWALEFEHISSFGLVFYFQQFQWATFIIPYTWRYILPWNQDSCFGVHCWNQTKSLSSWWFFTNPFEKICSSNWIISPDRDENKKYLKPPPNPSAGLFFIKGLFADCTAFQKTEARSAPPHRNPTFTIYLRTRKPTGGITYAASVWKI